MKMVKHIVMWKLHDIAEGNGKLENAKKIKSDLESLKEVIKEIIEIEVGINELESDQSYDILLYSTFKDFEDLNIYQNHPDHKKVAEFIGKVKSDRIAVDYTI